MGATGLASILTTWGQFFDTTPRPTILAGSMNDVVQKVEAIDTILGAGVDGGAGTVANRLAAISTSGTFYKQSARAVSTSNITLSGTQTIDGVSVIAGDRVLVAGQSTAANNGVYVVASGAWARASDFDIAGEFPGSVIRVLEGNNNQKTQWSNGNTNSITLNTTAISFLKDSARTTEFYIAANNNPIAKQSADFICDGTSDDTELNTAYFAATLAGNASVRIHLSTGTFTFAGSVVPANGSMIEGAGPNATIIQRSADVIVFDLSGTYTGGGSSAGHRADVTIRDLRINGSISPHTNPAVRIYYGNHHLLERVEIMNMSSIGLVCVEWYDSHIERCRFQSCGTQGSGLRTFSGTGIGSGGKPAVLILGDTQTSGFGHTDVQNNNLRFTNCTWESNVDCALLVHGNGGSEDFAGQVSSAPNKLWFQNCKVESLFTGYAPQVHMYRTSQVWWENNHLVVGNYLDGSGTAQNEINFDTCSAFRVFGQWLESQGNHVDRTYMRFKDCQAFDVYPILMDDSNAQAPSVAIVEITGTCDYWVRQPDVQFRFRNAHSSTLVSGNLTSCQQNKGTATITTGNTSVVVNHGLSHAPGAGDIQITATAGPTSTPPGLIWWDTPTTTQFTIHCAVNPGASGLSLAWYAQYFSDAGHL